MGVSSAPRFRPTARLFVLDPLGRLLLFRFRGYGGSVSWLTPGGGLHRGETVQAAAVRELAEETGYLVTERDLGPVVATRGGLWRSGSGRLVFGADTYFLVRVTHSRISTAGHEELERSIITGHRWWAMAELRETTESISPPGAVSLIATLTADGPPPRPIRLPWRTALSRAEPHPAHSLISRRGGLAGGSRDGRSLAVSRQLPGGVGHLSGG